MLVEIGGCACCQQPSATNRSHSRTALLAATGPSEGVRDHPAGAVWDGMCNCCCLWGSSLSQYACGWLCVDAVVVLMQWCGMYCTNGMYSTILLCVQICWALGMSFQLLQRCCQVCRDATDMTCGFNVPLHPPADCASGGSSGLLTV
jgi:hypothetical protein